MVCVKAKVPWTCRASQMQCVRQGEGDCPHVEKRELRQNTSWLTPQGLFGPKSSASLNLQTCELLSCCLLRGNMAQWLGEQAQSQYLG